VSLAVKNDNHKTVRCGCAVAWNRGTVRTCRDAIYRVFMGDGQSSVSTGRCYCFEETDNHPSLHGKVAATGESVFYGWFAVSATGESMFYCCFTVSATGESMFYCCFAVSAVGESMFRCCFAVSATGESMFYGCFAVSATGESMFYCCFTVSATGESMFYCCLRVAAMGETISTTPCPSRGGEWRGIGDRETHETVRP